MTGCPRAECSPSATIRPIVSVGPPAGNGTTRVIARDGTICALALLIVADTAQAERSVAIAVKERERMGLSSGSGIRMLPSPLQLRLLRHKDNSLIGYP